MKVLRQFSSVIAVLIFGALIWLAVYAYEEGFTKKWRKLIVKEFAKHDLNISFEKLTIDPFQGLVANNVVLLEHDTQQEVARISQVRLAVDLAKLIRKERFLERIELESANLSLPYLKEDSADRRLELKDFNAIVVLPRGRIEIARAQADFYGLQVRLGGFVRRPGEGDAAAPFGWQAKKLEAARPILEGLVGQLERLAFKASQAPALDLVISGDLARPETLTVKAKLEGEHLRYGDFRCRQIRGEATLTEESVKVANLTLTDEHGHLGITGEFPLRKERQAELALDSSIDLGTLLPAINPDLPFWSWITLLSAPELSLQGTIQLDKPFKWQAPPVDIVGHLRMGSFLVGDEPFEHFAGDFHVQGPRFFARNLVLKHVHGESKGKILSAPESGVRYDFSVGMAPTLLGQLPVTEEITAFLERWTFRPNSGVTLQLSGERKGQETAAWDHRGHAVLTDCQFETAGIDRLALEFQLNPHAYHFSNIKLQLMPDLARNYSGGTIKAQRISVSARDHLTMLTNVTGYVDPGQVVRCFSPKTADQLDCFRFSSPPEVRIPQGTIDPEGIAQTNLQVEVKAGGTMTTQVLGKPLPLEAPRFGLLFHKENLIVRADHAGLFDGQLLGNLDIRNLSSTRDYTAKIELSEIDFGALCGVYFPEHQSDGRLTGHFSWRGQDDDLEKLDGKGVVHLRNSRKLEVPLLGPLSALVNMLIGKTKVSDVTLRDLGARFAIKESVINLETIAADLAPFRVEGQGTIELETEEVDLQAFLVTQADDLAVIGLLYEIFGKYECTGTLKKPKWTLVNRFTSSDLREAAKKLGNSQPKEQSGSEALHKLETLLQGLLSRDSPGDTAIPEDP